MAKKREMGKMKAANATTAQVDVSVIIPAYNEEKYIGACLASLKRQQFNGTFEIILGDGSSTDNTPKIARDYGAQVVREQFGTPSGGRYAATQIAKGKVFAFISADVEATPGWIQETYNVYRDRRVAWSVGSIRPLEGNILEEIGAVVLNFFAHYLNSMGIAYVNADNLSARAESYRKIGGFNPNLVTAEDTDLGRRLMKAGRFKFAGKAKTLLSMRRVRKWGYFRFVIFHTTNFFVTHIFSSPSQRYDPVR
jgi:glycosyltransferase involved in cell wall biosynthesis